MTDTKHIEAFKAILGKKAVITEPETLKPHLEEWRGKFFGQTDVMLMPPNSDTLAKAVKYCSDHDIKIVPQGGNTGLVGGSLPGLGNDNEILINTSRMSRVLHVDSHNMSITAEAGCTVAQLQAAAAEHALLFPLSLASEGSCTVGGIISTNAGGVHVLRYGTTRTLTLGLEAVLPSGKTYSNLNAPKKDNTGYALDQLLIGAEGTLGIITKATLKLTPAEIQKHTFWLAVNSPKRAVQLLGEARRASSDRVSVFEIMPQAGLEFVLKHIAGTRNPLTNEAPWYLLVEVASGTFDTGLERSMLAWLESAIEAGSILDGAMATSESQSKAFWRLRESISEAQKHEGGSIKHDISVPLAMLPEFIVETTYMLEQRFPACRVTPFGHVGDGNLHFNVMQPQDAKKELFLANWDAMNRLVHDQTMKFGGSISAEHGIGSLKKSELARTKPAAEIKAMQAIKNALDPKNIMNPNVLFL